MKNTVLVMCVCLVLGVSAATAAPVFTLELSPITVSGGNAVTLVTGTYNDDGEPGTGIVQFGLDVMPSSPSLLDGSGGYSAWTFTLDSALTPDWLLVSQFDNLANPPAMQALDFNPLDPGILAGIPTTLGEISVDVQSLGLTQGSTHTVAIDGFFTNAGWQGLQDFGMAMVSYETASQEFTVPTQDPVIPEPATMTLLGLAVGAVGMKLRRRRSA
ncbi:MAG: PEP-CTERM sorting domain-containing protein [Planctomycetota bacterium]